MISGINGVLNYINDFLYSNILIVLLIAAGIYFTIRTKFVQLRLFPEALRAITERPDGQKVSSFQALMISTASRVGTGNIAGITAAIVTGGPGAVFWMWVMALIGAASAFVESTLAQVYKSKDGDSFRGGPSYYIQKALGNRFFGVLFSILLVFCFAYGFNALHSYTISSSFEYYIDDYAHTIYPFLIGVALTILTAVTILGGVKRIGFITSYLVPAMALVYMALGIFITIMNIQKVPQMFGMIFSNAFDFRSIFGGFAGSVVLIGIKRGLFSNEAGMGSAPNAAATADVSHPVKQGLVQIISVFIDTILICSTSAFIVLLSGVDLKCGLNGIPFVQAAVENQIGSFGIHFITFSVFTFAFTSIIGNYCYIESNVLFIKNSKKLLNFVRATCLLAVFLGSQASFGTVWDLADVLMGLLAILNIIAILLLGNTCFKVLNDYINQRKSGKDPVFKPKELGIENTEAWD